MSKSRPDSADTARLHIQNFLQNLKTRSSNPTNMEQAQKLLDRLTPDQKKQAKEYAKAHPGDESALNLYVAQLIDKDRELTDKPPALLVPPENLIVQVIQTLENMREQAIKNGKQITKHTPEIQESINKALKGESSQLETKVLMIELGKEMLRMKAAQSTATQGTATTAENHTETTALSGEHHTTEDTEM